MTALIRILGRRSLQAIVTAWVLATLCFAIVHAMPGELAVAVAVARVGAERVSIGTVEQVRREEGLDQSLLRQYGDWLGRVVRLDLGRSLVTRRPVVDELRLHAGQTLVLGAIGWLLSYAIALPLGLMAGLRPNGFVDRATLAFSVCFASLPPFLAGIGLVTVFALTLRWLPPAGFGTASHMVLPATTLALGLAAFSLPVIRTAVLEVRNSFYMTFAELRGLGPLRAFGRHGVRNAAIPAVTFAALQFAFVVDGFVVIEVLFNHPGLGDLLVKALVARDVPIVMGATLLIGWLYAVVSLTSDVLCLALDPRRVERLAA
jgi:peptide/nickel transport system permease protein